MNYSLQTRIVRSMWILTIVVGLFTISLSTLVILRNSDQVAEDRIQAEEANLIELGVIDLISLNDFREVVPRLPEIFPIDRLSEVIRIYNPRGDLLFTNVRIPDFANVYIERQKLVNHGYYRVDGKKRSYMAILRSHITLDGELLWVEIATPRQSPISILKNIATPFILLFLFLFIASLFVAKRITQRVLHPLNSLSNQLSLLNIGNVKMWQPITVKGEPTEFKPMTLKVNELLGRMQSVFLKLHQWSRFIAHEIRTPLTVIRGEIETTLGNANHSMDELKQVLQSTLDEVGRMDNIVETVLRLSKLDGGAQAFQPKMINIVELIETLIPKYERWIGRKIETRFQSRGILGFLDIELFDLLMSNVVRNISKHTPLDGKATIEVITENENEAAVYILDQGPGLPMDILENLAEGEITSHGIGLQLCFQIAQVSNIKLQFSNRTEGGLQVKLLVPA